MGFGHRPWGVAPGDGMYGRWPTNWMANGLLQHSPGQRPWNTINAFKPLANGHIQPTINDDSRSIPTPQANPPTRLRTRSCCDVAIQHHGNGGDCH